MNCDSGKIRETDVLIKPLYVLYICLSVCPLIKLGTNSMEQRSYLEA
jgi:hypothetical protein